LRVSRKQGLDAAEYERRQIERNLNDGARPRLVAPAMGLGMVKEKRLRGEVGSLLLM